MVYNYNFSLKIFTTHLLVKNKIDLIINGDPNIQRDYIYISNFCNFLQKIILKPKTGIFNLVTGLGVSILDLFKTSYKILNKKFEMDKITNSEQKFNFQSNQNIHEWLKND